MQQLIVFTHLFVGVTLAIVSIIVAIHNVNGDIIQSMLAFGLALSGIAITGIALWFME
jgi:hypothetical protein